MRACDVCGWTEAECVCKRRPKTMVEAAAEVRAAFDELGRALLDSPPGRCVEWAVDRLARLLRRGR